MKNVQGSMTVPTPDNLGIAVVHGNLVTRRQPGDIAAFTRETLNLFAAARGA
jgi:putative intracellular protease/amidase